MFDWGGVSCLLSEFHNLVDLYVNESLYQFVRGLITCRETWVKISGFVAVVDHDQVQSKSLCNATEKQMGSRYCVN